MQFVPMLTLREGALIARAMVAVILFVWFLARLSHRPYFVVSQSQSDQTTALHLVKIADAIDRLTLSLENRPHADDVRSNQPVTEEHGRMGLSMFAR